MKRSERHRLKEIELAVSLTRARGTVERYKREIALGTIAALVLLAAAVGYFVWRGRINAQSHERLADAMAIMDAPVVPPAPPGTNPRQPPQPGSYPSERARLEAALPKFNAVSEAYPSTAAGLAARYHAASALAALGRTAEAISKYDEVVQRAGDRIYGQTARLGKADTLALAGKYEEALAIYRDLAARTDGTLPVDAVLMQLGRTCVAAGKETEARQAFTRIVDEFPESTYLPDARRELDNLAAKVSARSAEAVRQQLVDQLRAQKIRRDETRYRTQLDEIESHDLPPGYDSLQERQHFIP